MDILLTGFEPFGGADVNPSWEAVQRVPQTLDGHTLHKRLLPVVFGQAAELLRREIARIRPGVVICCGVASGRTAITPELVAINYRSARIPDNAGQSCSGMRIDPQGPAAYMTSLPVEDMVTALKAAELPAYLSLSAGAYVCNDVYYALLACEAEYGHKGLFLHVPDPDIATPEQVAQAIGVCVGLL